MMQSVLPIRPDESSNAAFVFDHPIIDVVLGLIFFYVVLSLVASAVQEWIASICALRAKNLWTGVQTLVGNDYATLIYKHPLIDNLARKDKRPSYIAPETLTTVLLHVIVKQDNAGQDPQPPPQDARALVDKIPDDHALKDIVGAILDDGQGSVEELRSNLASWFDEGMNRVSGWYKRQTKILIFAIAAGLTIATNASSIHIAEELWRNDALRTQIAAQAESAAQEDHAAPLDAEDYKTFESLPIGWDNVTGGWHDWFKRALGWLITTAAISLGAPFWFDLLGKVANLRGSGAMANRAKSQ